MYINKVFASYLDRPQQCFKFDTTVSRKHCTKTGVPQVWFADL